MSTHIIMGDFSTVIFQSRGSFHIESTAQHYSNAKVWINNVILYVLIMKSHILIYVVYTYT